MARFRKARVLVADPEPVLRFGLIRLVNSHPRLAVCAEAETLGAARDLAIKYQPAVIVLDPAMGEGMAFIKDLSRWCAHTRVVAFTSIGDAPSVQRAFKAGVCGYVTRRDSVAALMLTILGALDGERRIGPIAERALLGGLASGAVGPGSGDEAALSDRELQVFRLLGQGLRTRAVAEELRLSVKTIETHRQRIREKLHLADGAELQRRAVLSCGLFPAPASDCVIGAKR